MDGRQCVQPHAAAASGPGLDRHARLTQPGHVPFHGAMGHPQFVGESRHGHRRGAGDQDLDDALLPLNTAQGQVGIAGRGSESLGRQCRTPSNPDTGLSGLNSTVDVMATDRSTVIALFDTYAQALSAIDLDTLAACYSYPALALTRTGRQAVTEPEQTRAFFAANGPRYLKRGIVAVRITNLRTTYDSAGLWIGLADLQNLDADGNVVDVEMNAYQLARDDEGWTIAVTTPLEPH